MTIYQQFKEDKNNHRKQLAILLDPDKIAFSDLKETVKKIQMVKADYVFVGGSLLTEQKMDKFVKKLKKYCKIPVILFPGSPLQISTKADAILFLSLISGRNPEFLIGHQVEAAPMIAKSNLEPISTGYILIENGHKTSVEYISNTQPIPRKKKEIAVATALAGEMLGLQTLYLEAGSGAKKPVPHKMIREVAKATHIPLIVGGGIRSRKQVLKTWNAGADIVVVGTAFENNNFK